ncbi:hypothetical protein LTEGF4_12750 [Limnohabitans sp. TEGF004]|nr:hypothetical protein LTEGF4_12750 [Limnohabitans sp. TEGF004]
MWHRKLSCRGVDLNLNSGVVRFINRQHAAIDLEVDLKKVSRISRNDLSGDHDTGLVAQLRRAAGSIRLCRIDQSQFDFGVAIGRDDVSDINCVSKIELQHRAVSDHGRRTTDLGYFGNQGIGLRNRGCLTAIGLNVAIQRLCLRQLKTF